MVNAGGIDKNAAIESVWDRAVIQEKEEGATRADLDGRMKKFNWDETKKAEAQGRLRLMTMRDYLKNERRAGQQGGGALLKDEV